jgi:hypothetical protein
MSDRTRPRFAKETPIERIFEKVMHRKMTQSERLAFRLDPLEINKKKFNSRNGGNDEHPPDLK